MNKLQEFAERARQRGDAEFLGATMLLRTEVRTPVTLSQIRDVFLNSPDIPDEWAPEAESDIKLYLSTMVELNRVAGIEHFDPIPGTKDAYEFDTATHHRYIVKKIPGISTVTPSKHPQTGVDMPVMVASHLVRHDAKVLEDVLDETGKKVGETVVSYDADPGIWVDLVRIQGDPETDRTGQSDWSINFAVPDENGERRYVRRHELPAQYQPFIRTLLNRFTEKINRQYGTKEVRDILLDLARDYRKLGLMSVARGGFYYVRPDQFNALYALKQGFSDLDPGIVLYTTEVYRWDGDTAETNQTLAFVQDGIKETIQDEMAEFLQKLQSHMESDSTRLSTWAARQQELLEFRERIEKLHSLRIFEENVVIAQYESALAMIRDGKVKSDAIGQGIDPVSFEDDEEEADENVA